MKMANGRRNVFAKKGSALILLAIFILTTFLLVELGYRFFLSWRLIAESKAKIGPDPAPTFGFYAYPAPWRFDEKLGFVYNENGWLSGNIVKGAFNGCGIGGPGNRYGNAFAVHSNYETAALKILLLGSSFTMVGNKEGLLVHDLLEKRLSERLGRPVSILNFSRDATGLLNSFDIARTKVPELKPDLLLFVLNTTQFEYQRHWRVVHRDPHSPGMWRMSFSLDPDQRLPDRRRVILQPHVISTDVTQEWCDRLTQAMKAGDQKILHNDPMVRKLIATHLQLRYDLEMPLYAIDFYATDVSFVYNKLVHRTPYHRMKLYEENTIYAPLAIDDFGLDKQFVEDVEFVKNSGIPFLLIHIPTINEMGDRLNGNFDFGAYGMRADREQSLAASVERLTGKQIIHLYSYYDEAEKRNPLSLVHSPQDGHPSQKGVEVMAHALERLLIETLPVSPKALPLSVEK
jgi:hypothetical protein